MRTVQETDDRIDRVERGIPIPDASGQWRMETVARRMERYGVPAMSVAVMYEGRTEWARGYGQRDIGAGDAVSPDTLFQAASISKPITALAALRLADRGELDLDRDVNSLLRSWKVPFNPGIGADEAVTVRRLVSHTAGLTVHGFPGYERGAQIPSLLQILNGEPPANSGPVVVDTPPGTTVRYSGGGYCVLQQLLIEVTGQDFPSLMHDLILEPLEMTHSSFRQPPPEETWGRLATGYRSRSTPVPGNWHIYPEMAAAGLWTTPSDLLRVAIAVQQSRSGAPHAPLSPRMTEQLFTPQVTGEVGLGFFLRGSGHDLRFSHSGGNDGFRCELTAYADGGMGAAVMTNADDGGYLAYEVLGAIAREYRWPNFREGRTLAQVEPSVLQSYAGEYEHRPQEGELMPAHVQWAEDRLTLSLHGGSSLDLHPQSPTDFFSSGTSAIWEFVRKEGTVAGLVMRMPPFEMTFVKVA